ncbi:MAG: 2Fe-2S iron-sulfur cluster binding domain-containing protein [Hyphomicrobiaceae bacterium]|nr:2Fe-2S iron-sulfur cluster binding domain-containing protein [Hyphomicrobiaceae bacterium]
MTRISLSVNGRPTSADVAPRTHLADFLREQLLLTGTHLGCEHGICGACTVEIDGEIARSCITYAVACDGARVRTIEGFDDDPMMTRLRQAFTQEHALQCGYCTPGMLIAARDLLRRKGGLGRNEIRIEMSGNLCRCTGYTGIINAIGAVMAETGVRQHAPASKSGWRGPAPGPEAGTCDAAELKGPPHAYQDAPAQTRPLSAASTRRPIKVTVGRLETIEGRTSLTQSFVLPYQRDAVWRILSNPVEVAGCMPGMVLDGPPLDGRATGRMEVRLGPIVASFAGEGTYERFDEDHRQVIEGKGSDRRSGSRASGRVEYQLLSTTLDGAGATEVQTRISYVLTGPLAQFSRSGLVRDLVARIGEMFAEAVDARLSGKHGPSARTTHLSAFRLMLRIITARILARFRSFQKKISH